MSAPIIHGKGRIMFSHFEVANVDIASLRTIPGGPEMDEDFVKEGVRLLEENPDFDFPYVIAVYDVLERCYWVIEGRHRSESYRRAGTRRLTILVGRNMKIMEC